MKSTALTIETINLMRISLPDFHLRGYFLWSLGCTGSPIMQGTYCQTGSSHLNCLCRNFKHLKLYYSNNIISCPKNLLLSRLKWLYQFQVLFTHFILSWTLMVYYVLEEDYPSLAYLIVNVIQSLCTRRHILVNLLCISFTSTISMQVFHF